MTAALPNVRTPDYPIDPLFVERWSPRAFSDAPISGHELFGLLEAARWAPSALNLQPWRFAYALRGDAAWAQWLEVLVPNNRAWASHAAALVAIASQTDYQPAGAEVPSPIRSHAFDAGAAWAHLALQATRAGWRAHAMGGFDRDAAGAALRLPPGHALHVIVAIGRQGDAQSLPETLRQRETPSARRPIAQAISHGGFA